MTKLAPITELVRKAKADPDCCAAVVVCGKVVSVQFVMFWNGPGPWAVRQEFRVNARRVTRAVAKAALSEGELE